VIQQGWLAEITMTRKLDHPGQQQIIDLGINLPQGRQADRGSDQGEIDVGGEAVAADSAGVINNHLLVLGMGAQQPLDGVDR
jgi:hypothetical protein